MSCLPCYHHVLYIAYCFDTEFHVLISFIRLQGCSLGLVSVLWLNVLWTSLLGYLQPPRRLFYRSFVCPLATSRKNYWPYLYQTVIGVFRDVLVCTRKNWLSFGSHPPLDPDRGIFWRILQHCKIGALFHTLAQISGKFGRMFMKISPQICIFGQGSSHIELWKLSSSGLWIHGLRIHTGSTLTAVYVLRMLLFSLMYDAFYIVRSVTLKDFKLQQSRFVFSVSILQAQHSGSTQG